MCRGPVTELPGQIEGFDEIFQAVAGEIRMEVPVKLQRVQPGTPARVHPAGGGEIRGAAGMRPDRADEPVLDGHVVGAERARLPKSGKERPFLGEGREAGQSFSAEAVPPPVGLADGSGGGAEPGVRRFDRTPPHRHHTVFEDPALPGSLEVDDVDGMPHGTKRTKGAGLDERGMHGARERPARRASGVEFRAAFPWHDREPPWKPPAMTDPAPDPQVFLDFSENLVREAAGVILPRFGRAELEVDRKGDDSPVTEADREAEARMRELIEAGFPDHGIIGEEHGAVREGAEFVWVLDPIDGTKSFITGVPLFTTLVALLHRGRPLTGAIYQPVLDQLMLGDGRRTTLNGREVRAHPARPLAEATLLTSDPADPRLRADGARWDELVAAVRLYRSWGDAYGYLLLAAGFADIMVDPVLEVWDVAALLPVLAGAGVKATGWRGGDPMEERSLVAARPELHAAVMRALGTGGGRF